MRLTLPPLLLLVAGCAVRPAGEQRLAFVEVTEPAGCTVTAEDRPFALPRQHLPLRGELRRLARGFDGVIVAAGEPAPSFRCRTEAMLVLRQAGFRRIGFLGDALDEPPP